MPLGFDRDADVVNLNDTAEVYATITLAEDDTPVPEEHLMGVTFTIRKPDNTETTKGGQITADGTGFVRYTGTDQVGEYKVVATFDFDSSEKRSVRTDFEVIDPFDPPTPTDEQVVAQNVWMLLEDAFDSEDGGPWLQDVTMATFRKEKMSEFISYALFDINQQNPPTSEGIGSFISAGNPNADFPLLAQGVLLHVIRHLMRSYTEQPQPMGAQVVYEDRRDYLQRWREVLMVEEEKYMRWVALWKRKFLGLGRAKGLVDSKAGRLIPAPMRTRNVGRGYY